jgi:SAM-dependent methyltransferase
VDRDYYRQMYRLEDSHWWFVARRNLICRALQRFSRAPITNILDVGCGTGGTLDRLRQIATTPPVGIDLEPLALELSRERGHSNLLLASATALPFPDNCFDAAVALDVLEHIPDDAAAAREIARVLAPSGILVVTVPAYAALWSGHDVALMHQRRYVAKEIRVLLENAGLEVIRLSYTVSMLFPLVWIVRKLQNALRDHAIAPKADAAQTPEPLNTLLRLLLDLESRLVLSVSLPFGLTVFAVARKPQS